MIEDLLEHVQQEYSKVTKPSIEERSSTQLQRQRNAQQRADMTVEKGGRLYRHITREKPPDGDNAVHIIFVFDNFNRLRVFATGMGRIGAGRHVSELRGPVGPLWDSKLRNS